MPTPAAAKPGRFFAERAADQWRLERAEIDADIEERIGAMAAVIARRVEAADLWLCPRSDDEEEISEPPNKRDAAVIVVGLISVAETTRCGSPTAQCGRY
jgi:hypothetical protein